MGTNSSVDRSVELEFDLSRDVWCVLGLPFDNCDMERATEKVKTAVRNRRKLVLCTPNVNFVVTAAHDVAFRKSVLNSHMSLLDGMPLLWISKLLGLPLPERVPGSGLIEQLAKNRSENPITIFFFGGSKGVGALACNRVRSENVGLNPVGYYEAGFGSIEEMSDNRAIQAINEKSPDLLLVALGAVKGQAWIEHNRFRLDARLISHLGATLNFLAGTVKRAPPQLQKIGLEWFWRILQEPSLWKRYAGDGMAFLGLVITRVLPCFMVTTIHGRRYKHSSHISIKTEVQLDHIKIYLCGAATRYSLPSAKPIFRDVLLKKKAIEIDISNLNYVDSAFIGFLIIVYKHANDNHLTVRGESRLVRKIIRYNCCEYLLG